MTDLDAFFAKKSNKGKKKGVIKLQEISDQLERRAMEQKDETEDTENKVSEDPNNKNRPTNENSEDLEWLGFDDTPTAPLAIKEMADSYVESEDEEKRTSAEPARTWKTNNEEAVDTELEVVKNEPAKYVVKAKKAARLDLNSEEMFPSIEKAPEVEQKLKEQEEMNRRTKLEERKQQEEREKEDKTKRESLYKPRHTADGESPRNQIDSRRQQQNEEEEKPVRNFSTDHPAAAVKSGEGEMNWRSKLTEVVNSAGSQDNWRNAAKLFLV
uniref:Clathrin light chain n=1 Tax=Globodera pallida TaxID=36090 RepID=A0A183BW28_GLOPA